jgi:hypothetical protein
LETSVALKLKEGNISFLKKRNQKLLPVDRSAEATHIPKRAKAV